MIFKTISVIGLGYIGLPTAAVIASNQRHVIGVDNNPQVVDTINQGKIHIVEPELEQVVNATVETGFLKAVLLPEPADAFLITVPTPLYTDHQPDISYVKSAVLSIAPVLVPGNLVVLESTSPVGTTEMVSKWLAQSRPDLTFPRTHGDDADIHIAYCPERVMPGEILNELIVNNRVIGGMSPRCTEIATSLYKIFVRGECVATTARTAEMCKLTENSFRDVNIAFANELSMICDQLDINVWELIQLANRHPRVNILQPGPGVGGHCIAVDPWFIVSKAPDTAKLIKQARDVNDHKPEWVLNKINEAVAAIRNEMMRSRCLDITVAIFGLAFKADIDDLRESPALKICQEFARRYDGKVLAIEPNIMMLPASMPPNVTLVDKQTAIEKADVLVLLVDHMPFKALPSQSIQQHCRIVDVRGVWSRLGTE